MDELRLWQVVRTPQQISGTMHQLLTGAEPGLIAYFHFDQLNGLNVMDSSGHGNDGTAAGSDLADALGVSVRCRVSFPRAEIGIILARDVSNTNARS